MGDKIRPIEVLRKGFPEEQQACEINTDSIVEHDRFSHDCPNTQSEKAMFSACLFAKATMVDGYAFEPRIKQFHCL